MLLKRTFLKNILCYFHIPFCDSKCNYCAFNSYVSLHFLKEKYMKMAVEQLKYELSFFKVQKKSISSLFIGGGTPSTIDAKLFVDFFKTIKPYLCSNAEITAEANPNSATITWLTEMKNLGLNRISFGVQSFFDEKLKFLGRTHNSKQATNAILNADKIGFKNISLDFMYATKLDTEKRVKEELKRVFDLPILHVSAYSLTIEKDTPFYKIPNAQNDDENLAHFIASTLNNNSFKQYEVSNFGLNCLHNLGYWQHKPYLGIGAGAVGFFKDKRYYTQKDIKSYIKNPFAKKEENLSIHELHVEKLFLGFRSKIGVRKEDILSNEIRKLEELIDGDKIFYKNGKYFCKDYFLADEIVLFLMD